MKIVRLFPLFFFILSFVFQALLSFMITGPMEKSWAQDEVRPRKKMNVRLDKFGSAKNKVSDELQKLKNEDLFKKQNESVNLNQVEIDKQFMRSKVEEYHIDSRYSAGNYLIYDCEFKHFACVNKDSFVACEEKRKLDQLKAKKEFRCTPIGKFDGKEECIVKNYDVQSRKILKKFCFDLSN